MTGDLPSGSPASLRPRFTLFPRFTYDLQQEIDANDLPGTAELRGKTYPDVGGLNSPNSAEIELSGEVTMPPMSDGPITFKAPFEFAGRFTYAPDLQTPSQTASLTGGGRVILELIPNGDSWLIGDITFEFRPARRD